MRAYQRICSLILASALVFLCTAAHAGGSPEDIQKLRSLLQPITSLSAQFQQRIVDVDGFEIKVLNGSLDLLARDHPTLIVEFTPSVFRQLGDEIQAVEQALRSIGYSFFTVSEDPIRDLTNHLNQLHDGDSEMVLLRVM